MTFVRVERFEHVSLPMILPNRDHYGWTAKFDYRINEAVGEKVKKVLSTSWMALWLPEIPTSRPQKRTRAWRKLLQAPEI
jgi:hypothetical protein